jgi:hypothetical protein
MRFLLIMKGDPPQDPANAPRSAASTDEAIAAMVAWNQDLTRAGVLLADAGLYPSWTGTRVHYTGGRGTTPRVVDGPFAESKEVIAGFSLIEVASREEAIEWARRCPVNLFLPEGLEGEGIEIRQVAEIPTEASADEMVAAVKSTLSSYSA